MDPACDACSARHCAEKGASYDCCQTHKADAVPRTAVLLASPMPSTAPAAPPRVPSTTCVEMRLKSLTAARGNPPGLPLLVLLLRGDLLPLLLIVLLVEGVDGDWLPLSES